MATLYELADAFRFFDFDIDEETGEILNEAELDAIELEYNEKLKNCIMYLKNKSAEAEALKAEKQRLDKRQKRADKAVEKMKQYIEYCLAGQKWESDDKLHKVRYRASKAVSVKIDPAQLPEEYQRHKAPEADKTAIKKALQAGEHIEGCELEERTSMIID